MCPAGVVATVGAVRRRSLALVAGLVTALVTAPVAQAGQHRSCGGLAALPSVVSAVQDAGDATTPPSCRVTARVSDVDGGVVTAWVYLPENTWNGRFQATGGGGFSGGDPANLLEPLRNGYATAATDAGHTGATADFALDADGRLNWPAIEDFGHEGVQDMTTTAKALIRAYYGRGPAYSYFTGCSTGGRQGVMEAQRHPGEYDGILAGAPVINYPRMQTGQLWGQLVMLESGNPVAPCKFEAAVTATVRACDTLGDGVVDDVIGDPLACRFDLSLLVGTPTPCGTITAADVAVMKEIQQGPRRQDGRFLWYGLAPGAPFAGLNDTVEVDGRLVGKPFVYDLWWFSLFLAQDRSWDWTSLTRERFEAYFDQAVRQYDRVLGAADPDLSAFRRAGGKLLLWHGEADFGVPFQGTIDYYERVQRTLGPGRTQQFARLFLAPGVGHCSGGAGPQLVDPFAALVRWVEQGKAPETLPAAGAGQTRPVCRYPQVARWSGHGDPANASSYRCA